MMQNVIKHHYFVRFSLLGRCITDEYLNYSKYDAIININHISGGSDQMPMPLLKVSAL